AETHDMVGQLTLLGLGAAVEKRRRAIVRVVGREDRYVVPLRHESLRQRLDMAHHAAGVRPAVGRDQCDAHQDPTPAVDAVASTAGSSATVSPSFDSSTGATLAASTLRLGSPWTYAVIS